MSKSGIVNVRMVITEEKMLSNIDKVQKLINPNSKKQIIQLDDDTYFKDLIESIKTYLVEYPKKRNFPASVYKAAYNLVEYATNQFEENTKQIEELIRQRETNIGLASTLKEALEIVTNKEEDWKEQYDEACEELPEDIVETLDVMAKARGKTSQNYKDAEKLVNARIVNLESNLHIEIDMERIEDRSKALSYIGIEIADALKLIPTPQEGMDEELEDVGTTGTVTDDTERVVTVNKEANKEAVQNVRAAQDTQYLEDTRFEVKPSLWQRIKQSKIGRAIRYAFRVRVVLELPALPEGRGDHE